MIFFNSSLPDRKDYPEVNSSFGKSIAFLYKNKEKITADNLMRTAIMPAAYIVSVAYMGGAELPLGAMLELWDDPESGWARPCPHCSGTLLIQGFGGSPLSGSGSGWGICTKCGTYSKVRFDSGCAMKGLKLARTYKEKYASQINTKFGLVELASKKSFDSSYGDANPMTLYEVMDYLHGATLDRDLVFAIKKRNVEAVRSLLDAGSPLNGVNRQGHTALMSACGVDSPEILSLLLERGADITVRNSDGDGVVNIAAIKGLLDNVRILAEHGADINEKNKKNGKTALINAACSFNTDLISYLLEHGADINEADKQGYNPIMYAVQGNSIETVNFLLEHGADIIQRTRGGEGMLSLAARHGNVEMLELLLSRGVRIYELEDEPNNPLISAVEWKNRETARFLLDKVRELGREYTHLIKKAFFRAAELRDIDMMRLVLEYGADINARTWDGMTALMSAVKSNDLECVKFFMENGADAYIENPQGKTALILAADMFAAGLMTKTRFLKLMKYGLAATTQAIHNFYNRLNPRQKAIMKEKNSIYDKMLHREHCRENDRNRAEAEKAEQSE